MDGDVCLHHPDGSFWITLMINASLSGQMVARDKYPILQLNPTILGLILGLTVLLSLLEVPTCHVCGGSSKQQ